MGFIGKLVHIGLDAIVISALLAGIHRSTGLTVALEKIPNKDFRKAISSYLELGQYVFDLTVVFMGRSSSFKRERS